MSLRGACLLLALAAAAAETAGDGVVRLENAQVVVEVVPRLGGRIASLRRPGGRNILAFVPAVLQTPVGQLPQPAADGAYLPGNGHVIWLGPQRAWWAQQDANPARRDANATWPPDPWLEYGAMQVVARDAASVELLGPVSTVSGLQLRLSVSIAADGAVVQRIEARNESPRTVSWDLWPNTRVRGDARVYAPYEAQSRLRLEHTTYDPLAERLLPAVVADGYLSFDTAVPAEHAARLSTGKAFLITARPRLFAAVGEDLLIAAAPAADPPGRIHPDHAPVEVFQCVGGDPARAVLELEFHSPYRTLGPGAAMRFAVAWRILPLPSAGAAAIRQHEAEALRLGGLAEAAAR